MQRAFAFDIFQFLNTGLHYTFQIQDFIAPVNTDIPHTHKSLQQIVQDFCLVVVNSLSYLCKYF